MKRELRKRLGELKVDIDEQTAEQHLALVQAELRDPGRPRTRSRRRPVRLAALVAAGTLLALPGAALASQDAVPGDLLYPIKRATESVVSVFDPNIQAENRVEELEIVVDRGAAQDEIADRLADAELATTDTDTPAELLARLDRVRERVGADSGEPGSQDRQQNKDNVSGETDDGASDPVPTSTTVPGSDRPDEPTTTTTDGSRPGRTDPPSRGDQPPRSTPPGESDRQPPNRDG